MRSGIRELILTQPKKLPREFFGLSGDDVRKFEPKTRLSFAVIDKSIKELRGMYKAHPEWFEVPKPKSAKGKNEVDYSIK